MSDNINDIATAAAATAIMEAPSHRSNKWYGWVPDLPDTRDHIYDLEPPVVELLPASVDLEPKCPPIYNQLSLGSCTANGIAGCMEFLLMKQGEADFTPSRLFIYYNERKIEGSTSTDAGAMIRDGIKSIATQGVCHETSWPYDIKKFRNKPTDDCYTEAQKFEALNYARVPQDLNTMKSILAQGLPFVFGFSVYTYFESQDMATKGVLNMPGPDEKLLGGHCFTKDTKISLLDGRDVSFEELIRNGEDKFWVYSCNEQGNVVPGLAHSPRKTGNNKPILRITLDNKEKIECTEDHPFMLRDGQYKKAIELKIGESLMPLYRKKSTTKGMEGYDMFWDNKKWNLTHRAIHTYMNGGKYDDEVVHHIDFNKLNNCPDNLIGMTWDDHTKLHNEQTVLLQKYAKSNEGRQKSKELMEKLWSDEKWSRDQREVLRLRSETGRLKQSIGKCGRLPSMKEHILNEVKKRDRITFNAINNFKSYNEKISQGIIKPTERQIEARRLNGQRINKQRWNHKIIGIEKTGRREDVYDITVEKYHNFALSSGVFVHNCVVAVGYDDSRQAFKIRNSWGSDWALNGYFWMPYDYVLSNNLVDDLWALKLVS